MKNPLQLVDTKTGEIMKNSLGYQQLITTLTAVGRKVTEQKFYELAPSDFVPVIPGNGAFQMSIINWRTYLKGESFETGLVGNSANNAKLAMVDSAFDQIPQRIMYWAKGIQYSLIELQQALQANTLFSLVESREKARKKQWDLGLQRVCFLGIDGETGLLNNANVVTDTTMITKRLSAMTADEFNLFVGTLLEAYRSNCDRTAWPTHFVIPESDKIGLANYPNAAYPLKTKLALLQEAFALITGNANFQILSAAYCDKSHGDGVNNKYVLYNYSEDSLKMDVPVNYTPTAAGSQNNFTYENAAFGAFTGVVMQRDKECMYFTNTAA